MTTPERTQPARHLWRGLFITSSITLSFLLYAHYTGQREHTQNIAVMGFIVATLQVMRYLCFFDPWLDAKDED